MSNNNQQAGQSVDQSTHFEVERFLVKEARALDEERFNDWLHQMLTKDITYQLPTQEVRYRKDTKVLGNSQTTYLYIHTLFSTTLCLNYEYTLPFYHSYKPTFAHFLSLHYLQNLQFHL